MNCDLLNVKIALTQIENYCSACEGLCIYPPKDGEDNSQRPCDIYNLKLYLLSQISNSLSEADLNELIKKVL